MISTSDNNCKNYGGNIKKVNHESNSMQQLKLISSLPLRFRDLSRPRTTLKVTIKRELMIVSVGNG